MSLSVVYSRALRGIEAPLVTVETHLSCGLPRFSIVGLPEAAVRESRYRVRSAILNTKFEFPQKKITVNLAPADLPKEGGRFDLPIALGILAASHQIPSNQLSQYECVGELALSGALRSICGALPAALGAKKANRRLIVPFDNAEEASLVSGFSIFAMRHLSEVGKFFLPGEELPEYQTSTSRIVASDRCLDLADVRGQFQARRALEIAAAGGHSVLFIGPPGTGKTMLASRMPGILDEMTEEEAIEVASIASVSTVGFLPLSFRVRPFRAPHHSASSAALVGGGNPPRPGEISLAHHGVLFLDELPEFNRHVLEALREPMESGKITISRASQQNEFPAAFQLIAAMNPCPCGYLGDPSRTCSCTREQVVKYRKKISGPILDRIDMQVEVARIKYSELVDDNICSESSALVKERVMRARQIQLKERGKINAMLTPSETSKYCVLEPHTRKMLEEALNKLKLSARSYHRILKIARTIADLIGSKSIESIHLAEAIQYRRCGLMDI